jgi:hypothetical protein
MTDIPPTRPSFADAVPRSAPQSRRTTLLVVAGAIAVLVSSWLVLSLVDRAWLDCAGDVEAGGRFALRLDLLVLVAPVTLLAFAVAVVLPAVIGKGVPNIVRWVAVAVGIALVAFLILTWAVPHPFRDAGVDASASGCTSTGIPPWWPAWLSG